MKKSDIIRVIAIVTAVIVGMFFMGCSKQGVPEKNEAKNIEKQAITPPASTQEKTSEKQSPVNEKITEPKTADISSEEVEDVPIRLTAIMSMGEVTLAGLVDQSSGREAMVQKGNIFRGFTIQEIDSVEKTVTLIKKGKEYTLKQTGDATKQKPPMNPLLAGNTNIPSVFINPDLRNIPMQHFEPTQDELSRGIDPNNSDTWPKGYKGPAIERFLAKMTPEERAAAEKPGITPEMMRGEIVEPTEDEIVRGIDPNNSDTWPEGYKGPAIEDLLIENPDQAAKLEGGSGIPEEFQLQGYEATPEEAARGINPNDPVTWPSDYRGPGIEDAMAEMKAKEAEGKGK